MFLKYVMTYVPKFKRVTIVKKKKIELVNFTCNKTSEFLT